MKEITLVATIKLHPEFETVFLEAAPHLIEASRREEGNRQYDLFKSDTTEHEYVFIERWCSQTAIEHHNATAHFQTFLQIMEGKIVSLEIQSLHAMA